MRPSRSVALAELPAVVYMPNGGSHDFSFTPSMDDYDNMGIALEEAKKAKEKGDSPIGAVLITPDGEKFPAHTTEFQDDDLIGHAEMHCVENARNKIGRNLGACMLLTTAEPCLGCAYFLDKGSLGMLIVGATREDAPEFFRRRDTLHTVWKDSRRNLTVVKGLRKIEAAELLTAQSKRH